MQECSLSSGDPGSQALPRGCALPSPGKARPGPGPTGGPSGAVGDMLLGSL